MRIVLLNQFYPPDVAPTGHYLRDLAIDLVKQGHDVTVIASRHAYGADGARPAYPARAHVDGVDVIRLPGLSFGRLTYAGKLADYAAYYARAAVRLLPMRRFDRVIALTTPPFLGLLAKGLAELGHAAHAHWIMDVYPDVMHAHGMIRGAPLRTLGALARYSFAGARSVVALSPSMAERLRAYVADATRVHWVPLWSPDTLSPWPDGEPVPLRVERGWSAERLVLLYSGNFGLGHRFDEFMQAAERLGPTGPHWVFAGQGRARERLERFAAARPDLPLEILPYAPESRLREHLCSADVHLISMDSRWEGTLLPSKLQASFATGKPVIFVGSPHGDLARWIEQAGAGWTVAEGDVSSLTHAIAQAMSADERRTRGQAARRHALEHFDRARCVSDLARLLLD